MSDQWLNSVLLCLTQIAGLLRNLNQFRTTSLESCFFRLGGYTYCKIPSSAFRNSKLNLVTLESRRNTKDLIMIHKIITGKCGLSATDFFTFKPSRTRGSTAKFSFPTPKTSQRAKFFTVRAGSKYLKLSKKSKIPMSLSAAKKHFR